MKNFFTHSWFVAAASVAVAMVSAPQLTLAAPLGSAFTYQGRLYDQGAPVNGYYDFEFRLYDSGDGLDLAGAPGPFPLSGVLVTNGLFTVSLDFGASAFNGAARWLSTSVRTNATGSFALLNPRQELKPAPYALHATTAAEAAHAMNADVAAKVAWSGDSIVGLPPGFADGVDDDTTYSAGSGLMLSGTTFSVSPGFGDDRFWRLLGNSGTVPGRDFIGTRDNQVLTIKVNNETVMRYQPHPGGPSIVGGDPGNTVDPGAGGAVIVGGGDTRSGLINQILNDHSAIVGGLANFVAGRESFIGGGWGNTNENFDSHVAVIGGGSNNVVNVDYGFIGGGGNNSVRGLGSVVSGGLRNYANGVNGTIAGGIANTNSAHYASIGGGFGNRAAGQDSVVAGGSGNWALSGQTTIGGGIENRAIGAASTVAGGQGNVSSNYFATVGGGIQNLAAGQDSVVAGGSANSATAGQSTVGGGIANQAHAGVSTIAGGQQNYVGASTYDGGGFVIVNSAEFSSILGGQGNRISSLYSGVGGGTGHQLYGDFGHVGGGRQNKIGFVGSESGSITAGTVSGGASNLVASGEGTIGGGSGNEVASFRGTIPGGSGALTRSYGQQAYASGSIVSPGDAQASTYVLRKQTTDNNQADLNLDGLAANIRIPVGSVWAVRIQVAGVRVVGLNYAAYEASGLVANLTGAPVLQLRDGAGAAITTARPIFESSGSESWQATPYVAGSGNSAELRIAVNGGIGLGAIKWTATIQTTEVIR